MRLILTCSYSDQMPNSWYFIHIYLGNILSVESLIKNNLTLIRISFHGSS